MTFKMPIAAFLYLIGKCDSFQLQYNFSMYNNLMQNITAAGRTANNKINTQYLKRL